MYYMDCTIKTSFEDICFTTSPKHGMGSAKYYSIKKYNGCNILTTTCFETMVTKFIDILLLLLENSPSKTQHNKNDRVRRLTTRVIQSIIIL